MVLEQLCDACDLMRAAPAFRSFCGGSTLALVLRLFSKFQAHAQPKVLLQKHILAMMALQLNRIAPYYLEVRRLWRYTALSLSMLAHSIATIPHRMVYAVSGLMWTLSTCTLALTRNLPVCRFYLVTVWLTRKRPWHWLRHTAAATLIWTG